MAWLSGYSYRKSITLSRASGTVTNYQMKLLLGESSGASGEDVDCGGLIQTDFDDVRFTTSDGTTLLDYWIEIITGTTPNQLATIWIEFDSIGTDATTFYMYYGKADATAVSNGANTFIAFDDFEWGNDEDNIDTNGGGITWSKTVAGTSTAKIDTAQKYTGSKSLRLHRDGTNNPWAYFTKNVDTDYAISWKQRRPNDVVLTLYHGNGTKLIYARSAQTLYSEHIFVGASTDTGYAITANTWQSFEIRDIDFSVPKHDLFFNGTRIANDAGMLTNAGGSNQIIFANEYGSTDVWIDHVKVRKWYATEPAWGSWGSQETEGGSPIWLTFMKTRIIPSLGGF